LLSYPLTTTTKAFLLERPQHLSPSTFPLILCGRLCFRLHLFPTSPGAGSLGEGRVYSTLLLAGFPPILHCSPSGQPASPMHNAKSLIRLLPRQDRLVQHCVVTYSRRTKPPSLVPPCPLHAGNPASPVCSVFSNMLVSMAAFMVIISLGSWPQNTLFIVNQKKCFLSSIKKK
jgi:hypothetical protein